MKNLNYTSYILIILGIFFFLSCQKEKEASPKEINDFINNIGHLDEPEEYSPKAISDPVITYETNQQGVEYEVTKTKFERAKRIDNYKHFGSDSKSGTSLDAINNVNIGSIIQGKYWRNDGDLISIGDFSRAPITITVSGEVNFNNGNSITVEKPTNANVTDKLNSLLSSGYSGEISADYNFEKTEAYSKEQTGLELGFKSSWLGNIFGADFNVQNSFETNTVVIYFKQKYFSIDVNLPSQPSGFFGEDVDLDALKSKISQDNPPGYISSIDFGRIIIAKATSSYSCNEMINSINAAFGILSLDINEEYKNILENSDFSCKVYGGSSTTIAQNAEQVINLIKEGSNPESLNTAKPISYQVSYLDGQTFRTGEKIEYTKIESEQVSENQYFDIEFSHFDIVEDCDGFPNGAGEFYYTIDVCKNETFYEQISIAQEDAIKINSGSSLVIDQTINNIGIPNIENQYIKIDIVIKEDDNGNYDLMGEKTAYCSYPFEDGFINGERDYTIFLDGGDACYGYLYFTVIKK